MRRFCALLGLLLAAPAFANTVECGGNAFSYVEVVERARPQRGPLIVMPDTLCADLIERRRNGVEHLSVHVGWPPQPLAPAGAEPRSPSNR